MAKRANLPETSVLAGEYNSGMTTYDIAKKYGVSQPTIHARLVEAGVDLRRPSRRAILPIGLITSEYLSGKTPLAIAKKYGINQGALRKRLVRAGVQLRSTKHRISPKE